VPPEASGKILLVDHVELAQCLDQGKRHLRVVGVGPRRCGQRALGDQGARHAGRDEEALAEGIAD